MNELIAAFVAVAFLFACSVYALFTENRVPKTKQEWDEAEKQYHLNSFQRKNRRHGDKKDLEVA